jgi:hypothetical protein
MPLYAVAVSVLIVIFSGSSYEFMTGEKDGDHPLTRCNLPGPIDDARDVYIPLTGLFVFIPLAIGMVTLLRTRRVTPPLTYGGLLVLLWAYRFFLMPLTC